MQHIQTQSSFLPSHFPIAVHVLTLPQLPRHWEEVSSVEPKPNQFQILFIYYAYEISPFPFILMANSYM